MSYQRILPNINVDHGVLVAQTFKEHLLPVAVPICAQLASRAVVTPAPIHEILDMRRAIAVAYRAFLTILRWSARGARHGRIPGTQD
jgi:hypothetical protein